jgi:hypothetical protein
LPIGRYPANRNAFPNLLGHFVGETLKHEPKLCVSDIYVKKKLTLLVNIAAPAPARVRTDEIGGTYRVSMFNYPPEELDAEIAAELGRPLQPYVK